MDGYIAQPIAAGLRNPDSQVSNCCRAIVRHVHSHQLREGDRLPPQAELCQQLGFSHNSVTPAMNLLADAGMIARRRGTGTVVVDLAAEPPGLWRIALALGLLDNSPAAKFGVYVGRFLHESVQRSGCHLRSYFLNYDKFEQFPHALEDFGLLDLDIESGRLDGLVTSALFAGDAYRIAARHQVVLGSICGWPEVPLRVDMDDADLLRQALAHCGEAACRRVAVVAPEAQWPALAPVLAPELAAQGLALDWLAGRGEAEAAGVAQALLQRAPAERPEALIVFNDMLTLALTTILSPTGYAPRIVAKTNKQIPLPYPLPVQAIEFDIAAFAQRAVHLVLERVRHSSLPPIVVRLRGQARLFVPVGSASP